MTNNRRENMRILKLAAAGKLRPEDLIKQEASIDIQLNLDPDYGDPEMQAKLALSRMPQPVMHQGKRTRFITLNL